MSFRSRIEHFEVQKTLQGSITPKKKKTTQLKGLQKKIKYHSSCLFVTHSGNRRLLGSNQYYNGRCGREKRRRILFQPVASEVR
jgi:hypothetical protein